MLSAFTKTAAPAAAPAKPEHIRPARHPDVKEIEAELREVRGEIESLEGKRQKAKAERRRIESEQREARDAENYERLSALAVEEDDVRTLGEEERGELLDLHGRAMALVEQRDAAIERVTPEIEAAIDEWAAPRLQELANACRLVLDLSGELMPTLKAVRDQQLRSRQHDAFHAADPSVPLILKPNLLGGRGQVQQLLKTLRQAGYEPKTP